MTQRNDGRGEINSLQNHFTAYLTVSDYAAMLTGSAAQSFLGKGLNLI